MNRFRNHGHTMYSETVTKIGLSTDDDKMIRSTLLLEVIGD
jgi:hypothetical protein